MVAEASMMMIAIVASLSKCKYCEGSHYFCHVRVCGCDNDCGLI